MNKDTVVASVIGFGLGLIAAIALWVVPRILPKTTPATKTTEVATTNVKGETTSPAPASDFEITSIKDGDISKTKDIKIEGTAKDAKVVVVTTAQTDAVLAPVANSFSTNLTLSPGANQIVVTTLGGTKEESKTLFVYLYEDPV